MKTPEIGSYVVGTVWSDGSPRDPWFIGFYIEFRPDFRRNHIVVYKNDFGKWVTRGCDKIRKINKELGDWFIRNGKYIEQAETSIWRWCTIGKKERLEFEKIFNKEGDK